MEKKYFKRREFLQASALGSFAMLSLIDWSCAPTPKEAAPVLSGNWLEQMIQYNDEGIPAALKNQHTDPSHPHFGGVPDAFQIYNPHAPAGMTSYLTCAYISPTSIYFHDAAILTHMMLAMDYVLKHQHEDGTIDLMSTNFHSTPDVAFVVEPTALAYKLLARDNYKDSIELRKKLNQFLLRAGDALTIGGIHTPNHRWVVCMALARIHELFPNAKYINRIDQWLNEKIDIDADGQYNERSTSVYSPMSDRWLITIAVLMNKPELFDPVRRNLAMTTFLIHPNGNLVTEMSRRQDQYTTAPSAPYFYAFHYMATHFKEESSIIMAHWLKSTYGLKSLTGYLAYLLEDEKLAQEPVKVKEPIDTYEKYFESSKLVRWRQGQTDGTLVAHNASMFSMHHEDIVIQAVRCATAFFGKGQFIAEDMVTVEDGYEMSQKLEGPYFQPLPVDSLPKDGDWDKMTKSLRPTSEVQYMDYTLKVVKTDHSFRLNFSLKGTLGVPVAIEISFKQNDGDSLSGVNKVVGIDDAYFLNHPKANYKTKNSTLWIKGARHEHKWTALRGALPKHAGHSIYITGYTPFEHELILSTQEIL